MATTSVPRDGNYTPVPGGLVSSGTGYVIPQAGAATSIDSVTGQTVAPARVEQTDGSKASYSAAITGLVPAASATDIFILTGSATKTVRVTRVEVSGIATTILDTSVRLLKHTTADSLGTATNPVIVPHDSNNAAATATVAAYTANPTINDGTIRIVRSSKFLFNLAAPTAGSESGRLIEDYGDRPVQAVVLRGINEQLAVNLNGVSVSGGSIDISMEWSEE